MTKHKANSMIPIPEEEETVEVIHPQRQPHPAQQKSAPQKVIEAIMEVQEDSIHQSPSPNTRDS